MGTIQMLNEDGTPFYANLYAESSVRVTIGEAYNLAASLRETGHIMISSAAEYALADAQGDPDLGVTLEARGRELLERADAIETTLDHDKYAQWAKVSPAWAIRAGAR